MKLTVKWVATLATLVLFVSLFVDTVPPKYKYRAIDDSERPELYQGYNDHQWSSDQLKHALLLALFTVVVILAIWSTPEKSWLGLYLECKRTEQRAKIAEAEAQIAKHKKDTFQESAET